MADRVRAEALELRASRERVTLLRRDCAKLIIALEVTEGVPGTEESFRTGYSRIFAELPQKPIQPDLDRAANALTVLASELTTLLIAQLEPSDPIGNPDQCDRHIQSTSPEISESEAATKPGQKETAVRHEERAVQLDTGSARATYPLGY